MNRRIDNKGSHGVRFRGIRGLSSFCSRTVSRFAFVAGLIGGLAAGWLVLPDHLYCLHPQPMEFNHVVHTDDAGMECVDCHAFRDDGSFTGIPAVAVCADCHAEPMGESTEELFLVEEYIEPGREIPWLVYSRQPQNVYFSHIAHVKLSEIECRRCHGDQGRAETLPPLEINRVSTYSRRIWGPRISGGGPNPWDSMKMNDCSACHAQNGVQNHCLMCHK